MFFSWPALFISHPLQSSLLQSKHFAWGKQSWDLHVWSCLTNMYPRCTKIMSSLSASSCLQDFVKLTKCKGLKSNNWGKLGWLSVRDLNTCFMKVVTLFYCLSVWKINSSWVMGFKLSSSIYSKSQLPKNVCSHHSFPHELQTETSLTSCKSVSQLDLNRAQ